MAACLGITVLTGCGESAAHREAIKQVLIDRQAAYKASLIVTSSGLPKHKHYYTNLNNVGFTDSIKKISFDKCPKDFRTSWLNYVQTWERFAEPSKTEQDERRLRENATSQHFEVNPTVMSLKTGSDRRNLKEAATALENQDTLAAMQILEKVAISHGVDALQFE